MEQAELQTASPVICAADILVPLSPQYLKLAASVYLVLLAQLYQSNAAGGDAKVKSPKYARGWSCCGIDIACSSQSNC